MAATPHSIGSNSATQLLASTTAEDIGRVNPNCEAQSSDCRTDCFNMRKIVAHIFGRNKACTAQIPEHCWVEWCRKHYQRLRHRMLEQGWIFLQINCLKTQLGRMEEWGQVQSWTILLQHKFQEELDREVAAQKPEDEAGFPSNSTKTTVTAQDDHANEHTKTSPNRFLHVFLGEKKTFHDVYAVIGAVENAANEGRLVSFPPLQFLPLIDATLHPPPPIARPRKQRKPKVYKNKAHSNIPKNGSDLETLANSANAKSSYLSSIRDPSPALKSSLRLHSANEQVATEPLPSQFVTKRPQTTTVSKHKFQYIAIAEIEARTASEVVTNNTSSEIFKDNALPVTQQSSSHIIIRNQVPALNSLLSIFSTSQDRVGLFADGMHGSGVDKGEDQDAAAFISTPMAEDEKVGIASKTLQVAQSLARRERSYATKKSSGGIRSSNSPENSHNSRRDTLLLAADPQKIKTLPPPGSSSIIDKNYGLIGYKTLKSRFGNPTGLSSPAAHRPLSHPEKFHDKTSPALASTEPIDKEKTAMKFDPYPVDPSRTYNPARNQQTPRQTNTLTAVKNDCERRFPSETHYSWKDEVSENNNLDRVGLDVNENSLASGPVKWNFSGSWTTPINSAQTAKSPNVMSIGNLLIDGKYTHATKRTFVPDNYDTSTYHADTPKKLATFAPSSSRITNGDCGDSEARTSSAIILASNSTAVSKPASEMTGQPSTSTRRKRLGNHCDEGSLLQEGQPLGKRRMRVTF